MGSVYSASDRMLSNDESMYPWFVNMNAPWKRRWWVLSYSFWWREEMFDWEAEEEEQGWIWSGRWEQSSKQHLIIMQKKGGSIQSGNDDHVRTHAVWCMWTCRCRCCCRSFFLLYMHGGSCHRYYSFHTIPASTNFAKWKDIYIYIYQIEEPNLTIS